MSLDRDGLATGLVAVEDLDPLTLHDQGGVLSIEDAAMAVGVSVQAVRTWVRRGQVFAFTWDGMPWVGEKSLYECERQRRIARAGRPRRSSS